jgi:hypothetical protein
MICTLSASCIAEDAAVLGWHVQQQGLTAAALRAFEAERIPRVKEVFGLTDKHAAKMKAGMHSCRNHLNHSLLRAGAAVLWNRLVLLCPACKSYHHLLFCQIDNQEVALEHSTSKYPWLTNTAKLLALLLPAPAPCDRRPST